MGKALENNRFRDNSNDSRTKFMDAILDFEQVFSK